MIHLCVTHHSYTEYVVFLAMPRELAPAQGPTCLKSMFENTDLIWCSRDTGRDSLQSGQHASALQNLTAPTRDLEWSLDPLVKRGNTL